MKIRPRAASQRCSSLVLLDGLAETLDATLDCASRRRGEDVRTSGHGLSASLAVPDTRSLTLDRVLSAEHAQVRGMLRDLDLLHDLSQRRSVPGRVLSADSDFLGSLSLFIVCVCVCDG